MTERLVLPNSSGLNLSVEYTIPTEQKNPRHIVITCHGFKGNGHSHKFSQLREGLYHQKVASATFDFTAHGNSGGFTRLNYTLSQQVRDIYTVVRHLETLGYHKFSLVGSSLGGTSAFLVAAKKQLNIVNISLIAPRFDFPFWHFKHWPLLWLDSFKYSFGKLARTITVPTFIIRALQDELVDNAVQSIVFDNLAAVKKDCILLDADHRFSSAAARNKVIESCKKWIIHNSN